MTRDEFARRRRQLMRMMGKDGITIVPAAPVRLRNGDVEYEYRQDSDFHYLTGFPEPEAVAVLIPGRAQAEYVLFVRDRDAGREAWDGARAGPDGATRQYGADDAFPITDIDEILPGLLENRSSVYYTMGIHPDFDQRVVGWVNSLRAHARQGAQTPQEFVALDHLLHDMRLYKSRSELDKMRRAAQIAARAHVRAMRFCRPGLNEYQVEAEILHEFRRHRAQTSYLPIVGGGRNACVLHYRANNHDLRDGDLLLIDAGCELDYYASDVTRTFPVNGRYSPEQRAIYEVVLEAQHAAIGKVRAGNHWNDPHDAAVRAITQGLVRLSLLKGRVPALIRSQAYQRSSCTAPGTGWVSTCTMSATTRSAGNGASSSPAWRSRSSRASTFRPAARAWRDAGGTSACVSRTTSSWRAARRRCSPPRCPRTRTKSNSSCRQHELPATARRARLRLRCRDRRRRHGGCEPGGSAACRSACAQS